MCAYAKLLKQNDGFTASEIAKLSGVEEEKARQVLDALQQLGVVVKRGRKYYHIADSHHEGVDRLLSTLSFYFPNPEELTREFDEAYSRVSDDTGYAQLKAIRLEMGLSQEVFYRALRKHVEENYYLIAGGEEGFVRKGVVYGIVKGKR